MYRSRKALMLLVVLMAALMGACAANVDDSMLDPDGDGKTDRTGGGGTTEPQAPRERIDRIGRPEITNFTIRLQTAKPAYNKDNVFEQDPALFGQYQQLIAAGVLFWDGLEGSYQWANPDTLTDEMAPPTAKLNAEGAAFVAVLAADYLVVDTSKNCDVNTMSYFDIEASSRAGRDWTTCGGRTPNDDIIDGYISMLIGGPDAGPRDFGDDVAASRGAATNSWPYMATPHAPPPAPAGDGS